MNVRPTRKVTAATAGAAAATLLVTVLDAFGVQLPPAAATSVATLAAFAFGWLTRETGR